MTAQMQFDVTAMPPAPQRMANARIAATRAMEHGIDKAERNSPGWLEMALERVRVFARNQAGLFTVETMRWVIQGRLPVPPDLRAWGSVTRVAIARGYIERTNRSAPTHSSHGADRPLYRKGANA